MMSKAIHYKRVRFLIFPLIPIKIMHPRRAAVNYENRRKGIIVAGAKGLHNMCVSVSSVAFEVDYVLSHELG